MALGDKYASLTELKDRLGISDADTTDDPRLTSALACASRGIEGITHRQFNDSGAITSRKYNASSAYVVFTDDFSTTVGLTVSVNTAPWIMDVQYELHPLNGVTDGVDGWPYYKIKGIFGNSFYPTWPGAANVIVNARWGWATVPDSVKEACLVGAEELFKLRDTPFGTGGYGDWGIIKVRENPFVCRLVGQYGRDQILAR